MAIHRDQKTFKGDEEALEFLLYAIRKKDVKKWNYWRDQRRDEEIDLTGVNIQYAHLPEINFYNTILDNSDLHEAKLPGSNLTLSKIRQSNLKNIDLRSSRMIKCVIEKSILTGAKLYGAVIENWNIINIQCDYIFKGDQGIQRVPLNRNFAKGEFETLFIDNHSLIDMVDLKIKEGREMSHVFLSYVHEDNSTVDKIKNDLENSGIKVWLDRDKLQPGVKWQTAISNAIRNGAYFLACFSDSYLSKSRSYMNKELRIAFSQLIEMPHDRVWFIPIKIDKCKMPFIEIGPNEYLSDIQYVDLSEPKHWDKNIKNLINQIK